MKFIKFISGERMCFSSLCAAIVMLWTFAFIKSPKYYTISTIGLEHRVMFFFLCLLLTYSTLINMIYYMKRINYNHNFFTVLVWICCIGMTLCSFTTTKGSRAGAVFHWTTALLYIAVVPLLMMWLSLYRIFKRKEKLIWLPMLIIHGIDSVDVILMSISFATEGLTKGKNGIMEIIPMTLQLIALIIANNTNLFTKKQYIKDI